VILLVRAPRRGERGLRFDLGPGGGGADGEDEVARLAIPFPPGSFPTTRAPGCRRAASPDIDRRLAVAVGGAESPSQPFAARISYLVGPDGKGRKAYPKVDPEKHASQVLSDLPQR